MPINRSTWDKVWMSTADAIGLRSRCYRADIGVVFVSADNQHIIAGYVGPPPNFWPANDEPESDCRQWCPRSQDGHELQPGYVDCVSCHGEMNAAARADERFIGGTAYVNGAMCFTCAKVTAACRLARVVMKINPSDLHRKPEDVIQFLTRSGIKVSIYDEDMEKES